MVSGVQMPLKGRHRPTTSTQPRRERQLTTLNGRFKHAPLALWACRGTLKISPWFLHTMAAGLIALRFNETLSGQDCCLPYPAKPSHETNPQHTCVCRPGGAHALLVTGIITRVM